jgi:hypothetical protein
MAKNGVEIVWIIDNTPVEPSINLTY